MRSVIIFGCFFLIAIVVRTETSSDIQQLNKKAQELMISNPEKAMEKLQQALVLSQKSNDREGLLITLSNIGNLLFQEKKYKESIVYLKRALNIAESNYSPSEIASISLVLGKAYNFLGDKGNALFYLDKAGKFFANIGNTDGLHESLQMTSIVYQSHNQYYQALHYGIEALKISSNFDDKEKIILSLGNLGHIYSLLNEKQKALDHFLQAVKIAEDAEPTPYLPILYMNVGILYRDINWQMSVNNLLKAYDHFNAFKNNDGMVAALTEIGISYKFAKTYDKTLNYFLRAKTIAEKDNNYQRIFTLNKEISDIYIIQKKYNKAVVYLDQNFNLAKELEDVRLEAEALLNLGNLYISKKSFIKATELLHESYLLAKQMNDVLLLSRITESLSTSYYNSGNIDKAYGFLKASKNFAEELVKEEEKLTFQMLYSVFEVANSEKSLEILRKTNEIERLEKERARLIQRRLMSGIVALVVLLVILIYVLFLIRRKNRILKIKGLEIEASNLALLEMNIHLEKQKIKLNNLNDSLNEANAKLSKSEERYKTISIEKDKLFSIVSHDLRGPFSSVLSFVKMMKRDAEKMSKKEITDLTRDLEDTAERINTLLENLLSWSMLNSGKIKFQPQRTDMIEVVEQNVNLFVHVAKQKQISIKKVFNSQKNVWCDKDMISAVIRNLLSNAIKFSISETEIVVTLTSNDEDVSLSIEDTGPGLTMDQLDEIYKGEGKLLRTGSEGERGSGLGLKICEEFLHQHESRLYVEQKKPFGSVFCFKLKIKKNT